MKSSRRSLLLLVAMILALVAASPVTAADVKDTKVEGVIVKTDGDSFILRDSSGTEHILAITSDTELKEKKSNPFRKPKTYTASHLVRGLSVEVKGYADPSGSFVARQVKFTDDDFKVAQTVESRVHPVEGSLTEAELNAERMSGQVGELAAVSNAARGGARAAQEAADAAMAGVSAANERIGKTDERIRETDERVNTRISDLDTFAVKNSLIVNFKVGNAVLSKEAKAELDQLAEQAKREKGYIIEVTGFASADGSEALNRRLSQRRADAVVQYLAENHMIPLRRIVTPFGYGEKQPVADNSTREGRKQNRRVEVKILVNRGLTESASMSSSEGEQ